jgi:hypothetical protein
MAFKTFAPGVLTASDVNTFLMNQAVITCTSSTRPSSPVEGMVIYETDTDLTLQYSGTTFVRIAAWGAWTTFTPTWNNLTLGNGTTTGAYQKFGRVIFIRGTLIFGSTTTVTGQMQMNYPSGISLASGAFRGSIGDCEMYDDSTGNFYRGICKPVSAGISLGVLNHQAVATFTIQDVTSATQPFTWAVSDELMLNTVFQSAS